MQQMKYVTSHTTIWNIEMGIAVRDRGTYRGLGRNVERVVVCETERGQVLLCGTEHGPVLWYGTGQGPMSRYVTGNHVVIRNGTWNMPISRMRPGPGGQGGGLLQSCHYRHYRHRVADPFQCSTVPCV